MVERVEHKSFVELTMLDDYEFLPQTPGLPLKRSEILQASSRKQGSNE
jgi:hypothetical protein